MTDTELDIVYTRLCKTMTELGEAKAALFLARFALLAIDSLSDEDVSLRLIGEASEGMGGGRGAADVRESSLAGRAARA